MVVESLPEVFGPDTLAAYLGVPENTIYRWRSKRSGPPGFRVGKYVRYRRQDVEHWLETQALDASAAA